MNQFGSPLERIKGARLTSVQFVLDYLILGFDDKGALTVLVWPEIHCGGSVLKYGAPGYRDALCSLIAHVVADSADIGNDTLIVRFDHGTYLEMSLASRECKGERAILTGPKHFLYVWSS